MKRLALIVSLVSSFVAAQPAPLEFKGIALGATIDEVRAKYHVDSCSPGEGVFAGTERCRIVGVDSFAGVSWPGVTARFRDGVLGTLSVSIPSRDFDAVATALAEKYGRPTSVETPIVQNRMGAQATNAIHRWARKDGGITAQMYAGNINEGTVRFVSARELQAVDQRQGDDAKRRKSDL